MLIILLIVALGGTFVLLRMSRRTSSLRRLLELVRRLVLGSTSRYRSELLQRLGLDFELKAPGTAETEWAGEAPAMRAMRLATAKATDAGADLPDALIIGSDQVAELDGLLLEKPGSAERAQAQLAACSGRTVSFHTALCLLDTRDGQRRTHVDLTRVHFRHLDAAEIARYANDHWIAPAASNAKGWASACSSASKTTTPPP